MLFFSSPSADLEVMILLLSIAVGISVGIYLISKKLLLSITTLSILSNIIFYLDSGSELFDIYNVKWIVIFTLDFWPYLNIALVAILIINFIKNKNAKKK